MYVSVSLLADKSSHFFQLGLIKFGSHGCTPVGDFYFLQLLHLFEAGVWGQYGHQCTGYDARCDATPVLVCKQLRMVESDHAISV